MISLIRFALTLDPTLIISNIIIFDQLLLPNIKNTIEISFKPGERINNLLTNRKSTLIIN